MASIYAGNFFNYSSSLFSSFGTANQSSSSNILSQYTSIQNGSYKKLLKAYYAKQEKEGKTTEGNSSLTKKEKEEFVSAKSDADGLTQAANKLKAVGKDSLFKEVTKEVTDEKTGEIKEVKEYDRKAITDAIKSFANEYNKVITSASEPDSMPMLRRTMQLTSLTKANSSYLSKVGITVGADNKLVVDEEKLNKAEISSLKSLFQGSNSYGGQVARKASDISAVSGQELAEAKNYSNNGRYIHSYNTGNLINSLY